MKKIIFTVYLLSMLLSVIAYSSVPKNLDGSTEVRLEKGFGHDGPT